MREIKFRIFDKTKNKMIYQNDYKEFVIANIKTKALNKYEELAFIISDYANILNADNAILMQYTGLKDKNGVEIYEGDIVKWNSITDNRYISSVCFKNGQYYPLNPDYTNIKECEVIGNIYENEELLECRSF